MPTGGSSHHRRDHRYGVSSRKPPLPFAAATIDSQPARALHRRCDGPNQPRPSSRWSSSHFSSGPISSSQRAHFTVPVATTGARRARSARCAAPYRCDEYGRFLLGRALSGTIRLRGEKKQSRGHAPPRGLKTAFLDPHRRPSYHRGHEAARVPPNASAAQGAQDRGHFRAVVGGALDERRLVEASDLAMQGAGLAKLGVQLRVESERDRRSALQPFRGEGAEVDVERVLCEAVGSGRQRFVGRD